MWSNMKNWGVLSLGKGYYECNFSSVEDMRRVRASGSVNSQIVCLDKGFQLGLSTEHVCAGLGSILWTASGIFETKNFVCYCD